MKRIIFSLVVLVVLLLGILSFIYVGESNKDKNVEVKEEPKQVITKEEKKEYMHYITDIEMQQMIEDKETFFVVISRTGCSHCEAYLPELKKVLNDYKVDGYVLDVVSIEGDYSFIESLDVSGTPTTLFYFDGEEDTMSRVIGSRSYDLIVEFLTKREYIKE